MTYHQWEKVEHLFGSLFLSYQDNKNGENVKRNIL